MQADRNNTSSATKRYVLTFVIPVLHPENSKDWPAVKARLGKTIKSIAGQDHDGWQAVIVANEGSDLPLLPPNFVLKQVNFPPNPMFEQGDNDLETFRDAVRFDKGRRVLAGLLHAGEFGHAMVVDCDDFVNRHLTSFVADHAGDNGWYVLEGYVWGDGGRLIYQYADFSQRCGTSHIIRADLYGLPESIEAADADYIRKMYGSHVSIRDYLSAQGTPLQPLPFIGAVYRIGHPDSHSKSAPLMKSSFFGRSLVKNPLELARHFARLRVLGSGVRYEFWGERG